MPNAQNIKFPIYDKEHRIFLQYPDFDGTSLGDLPRSRRNLEKHKTEAKIGLEK